MTSLIFSPNVKGDSIPAYPPFVNLKQKFICAYHPLNSSVTYNSSSKAQEVKGNKQEGKAYLFVNDYNPGQFIESYDTAYSTLSFYNPLADNGGYVIPFMVGPSYYNRQGDLMQGLGTKGSIAEDRVSSFPFPIFTEAKKNNSLAVQLLADLSPTDPSSTMLIPASANSDSAIFFYQVQDANGSKIVKMFQVFGIITLTTDGSYKVTSFKNRSNADISIKIDSQLINVKAGQTQAVSISINSNGSSKVSITSGKLTAIFPAYNGTSYFGINEQGIYPIIPQGTLTFNFFNGVLSGVSNGANMSFTLAQGGKSLEVNSTPSGFFDVSSLGIKAGSQFAIVYGGLFVYVTLNGFASLSWNPSGSYSLS